MPRFIITTLTQLIIASCTLLMASKALAEAPRWYEVEVAFIGYQDSQKIDHETWPEVLADHRNTSETKESENSETKFPTTESIDTENLGTEKLENPWAWIDWWNSKNQGTYNVQGGTPQEKSKALSKPFQQQALAFEDKAKKFERAKGFNIIWSKKWQQPIQEKASADSSDNSLDINFLAPLNLSETIKQDSSLDEIEISGKIYLYRSRYLHFVSDLQVQHWRTLMSNNELDNTLVAPHSNESPSLNIIPSNSSSPLATIDRIPLRAAKVMQSRRMRSKELHYLDHPMLGILVRAIPIEYQENLVLTAPTTK